MARLFGRVALLAADNFFAGLIVVAKKHRAASNATRAVRLRVTLGVVVLAHRPVVIVVDKCHQVPGS